MINKNLKQRIIFLSFIFISFSSLIFIFGFSYKKKIEEGFIQIKEMERNLMELNEFIKENQKYLINNKNLDQVPSKGLEERTKVAQKGYDLFLDYFSSYLLAFPKNQKTMIREVICILSKEGANKIFGLGISCYEFISFDSFKEGDYFIFGLSLNDLLERWNKNYNKNEKYSFCGIIKPLVEDPVMSNIKEQRLTRDFEKGKVICQLELLMNQHRTFFITGIVKKDISIKIFLISKDFLDKIKKVNSLEEAEDILNKNLLLWSN